METKKQRGRQAPDIVGRKFGRLTVLERAENWVDYISGLPRSMWVCRCDCGNIKTVMGANLKNGNTRSCGCLKRDALKESWRKRKEAKGELNR